MNRATPWTIQSVDPDLRDAARDAAMREGMTLHQWLKQVIEDHACERGIDADLLDHDERSRAILQRLPRMEATEAHRPRPVDTTREGAAGRQGKHSTNRVDDMLQDLAIRIGENARAMSPQQAPQAAPARADLAPRPSEHQSALKHALQEALRLARKESASQPRTQAPDAPRQQTRPSPVEPRVEEARASSPKTAAATPRSALRQQIDHVLRDMAEPRAFEPAAARPAPTEWSKPRQDAMKESATPTIQEGAVAPDNRALRRLSEKSDEIRELLASVIARPAQTSKLERQLDLLGARIDSLAAATPTVKEANDLARGLIEIRSLLKENANPSLADALDRKLDQLSHRLEAAIRGADTSPQFDDLARRIDNVHRRVEMNAAIAPVPVKADTSALERMLQELASKLEQPAPRIEIPAPNFTPIENELRRLSNKMDAVAARPENPVLEGLRKDIANLSTRVDAVSTTVQGVTDLASRTQAESLEGLRKEVTSLSSRIDMIASSAPEVSVLDGLQSQVELLVDRIEALPRREAVSVHALEAQIVKLAEKVDSISAPSREEAMLVELQTEIARLARQFGATPSQSTAPALIMLEQVQAHLATIPPRAKPLQPAQPATAAVDESISDLFQQIQDLRDAAADTVEVADRQAMREAGQATSPATLTSGVEDERLKGELADLRQQQEITDRRTTETLNAVHQTLETLVGRLGSLESDLGEVRPEPVTPAARAATAPAAEGPSAKPQEAQTETRQEAPTAKGIEPLAVDAEAERKAEPVSPPNPSQMRKAGPAAVMSDQASFIAAARRAVTLNTEEPRPKPSTRLADLLTQVSGRAPEVTAEQAGPPRAKLEPDANEAQGPFGALRRAMAARRRTMLIALAGLVVIIGSLQSLRAARSSDNAVAAIFEAAGRTLGKARAALPGGTSAMPQPPAAGPQTPTPVVASAVESAQTPPPSPRPSEPAPVVTAAAPPPEPASALTEAIIAAPAKTVAPGFSPPLAANGFDTSPTASLPAAPVAPQPGNRLADAATNGQANAQYEMGVRLSEGRGMAQDNQAAQQWLDKAARQNLAPAQYRLAAMLERGLGGPKDLKRAQELYTRAATQGHVRAMHNLGVLSAEGVDGKPDYATAVSWFRKAADFGLRDSQYNLAILYARGMGVDKNLPVSWAWFTAAAAQGDADSAQKREDIAARLTPNQMAAARTMVEAYRPRTADPVINDVASPPGGWDAVTVTNTPKPTTPAPKAKVSKL